jgi:hypothetical protein
MRIAFKSLLHRSFVPTTTTTANSSSPGDGARVVVVCRQSAI